MANLYLTEQGSIIRKSGSRIIVEKDRKVLFESPCIKIEAVLLFGNVQFTTQALSLFFKHGIELALLTKNGRLKGQLTSPFTKNIELRIDQYAKYRDVQFKVSFSKSIVSGKIENALRLIRTFSYNHKEVNLDSEKHRLISALKDVESSFDLNVLMGIEGIAAKTFFSGYGKMLLKEFQFRGRQKHPSPDPVNALLSLGYTMVFNEILSLLDGIGFDPYLGFFHRVRYGRASLACDLLEEFRAAVERLTLYFINNGIFKMIDFYNSGSGSGVYLQQDSLKRYFREYEKNIEREFTHPISGDKTTLRKCFRYQAQQLARCLERNEKYIPFRLPV